MSGLYVAGGMCEKCAMPITSVLDSPHARPQWTAPPIRHGAMQCPEGGRHRIRRTDGLMVAGIITPESIQEEAMGMSEISIALLEHVAYAARIRSTAA